MLVRCDKGRSVGLPPLAVGQQQHRGKGEADADLGEPARDKDRAGSGGEGQRASLRGWGWGWGGREKGCESVKPSIRIWQTTPSACGNHRAFTPATQRRTMFSTQNLTAEAGRPNEAGGMPMSP